MAYGQYSDRSPMRRLRKADLMPFWTRLPVRRSQMTAHNEVTYELTDGAIHVKLYDTEILVIEGEHCWINNGGWRTITTSAHINGALGRHGIKAFYYNNKRKGGATLRLYHTNDGREYDFSTRIYMNWRTSKPVVISDLEGRPMVVV